VDHFNTIRQRWKRAVGASLTIALLSAVVVVGLTLFASKVLAAWNTPAGTEQAFASSAVFEDLLNFEAPAATVTRLKTQIEEAKESNKNASQSPLLVKNWLFTQNPVLDFIQNTYIQGVQLQLIWILFFDRFFPNSPVTAFVFTFTKAWLQTADGFLTTVLHLPPVPHISPFF